MGGVACCIGRESDAAAESGALPSLGREISAPPQSAAVGAGDTCVALLDPSTGGAGGTGQAEEGEKKLEDGGQQGWPHELSSSSASEGRGNSSSPPPPDRKISGSSSPRREASGEVEGSCLLAQGFLGPQSLDGRYVLVPGALHHGRAIFRRPREKEHVPGRGRRLKSPAVLFFWDERDGLQHCGWCFGPHVGSKTLWAFNPGDVETPPVVGWRQPWFSEVLSSARVFPVGGMGATATLEEEQRASELLEAEVTPPEVSGSLAKTLAAFQSPQPLNICVDCRCPIRSPCALPCGHLVCLEHVNQANAPQAPQAPAEPLAAPERASGQHGAGEAPARAEGALARAVGQYKCPCAPECHTYLQNGGVAADGWGIASVAQQLLALAGPVADAAPGLRSLKASAFWQETAGQAVGGVEGARRGILACDTPLRLVAAYEWLGHEAGLVGRSAEAAASFAAARRVHSSFLGEVAAEGPEALGGDASSSSAEGSLSVGMCARRELMDCAVRWQREAGAKATAWAKRCGCRAQLAAAASELPAPAAEGLAADGRGIVEALRPQRAAARQILDCPVCYRLLHEPTTTPCGHTFCRGCLARVLDSAGGCPLCRGPLCGFVGFYAACRPLQRLVEELWPEETAAREAERAQELSDAHVGDGDYLPLLVPGALALPHQRFVFQVVQPHHRLLIRRALESGQRRVGMCLGNGDVGVELHLRWVAVAVDGRAAVECVGMRPFQVVQSVQRDGYSIANVQFMSEEEHDGQEARAARERLLAGAQELRRMARLQAESDPFPPLDDAEAWDSVAWAILAQLPAPQLRKYRCLTLRSHAERLQAIATLVQELLASMTSPESAPAAPAQDIDGSPDATGSA